MLPLSLTAHILVEFDRSFHLFSLREFHTVSSYMYVFKSHILWWRPGVSNPSRQDACKATPQPSAAPIKNSLLRIWDSNPASHWLTVKSVHLARILRSKEFSLRVWRLVGVSIPLPRQWQCRALPIELTKHIRTLVLFEQTMARLYCFYSAHFSLCKNSFEILGGDDWSRTSSAFRAADLQSTGVTNFPTSP